MKVIRWILGRIILILDFITRPKKISRPINEQNKIDELFKGHSIYQFKNMSILRKSKKIFKKKFAILRLGMQGMIKIIVKN